MNWKKLHDEKKIVNGLLGFQGRYAPLSNFYLLDEPLEVLLPWGAENAKPYKFLTVEAAYQACKTLDVEAITKIMSVRTPGQAKAVGTRVALRSDWEDIKIDVMRKLVQEKYHKCQKMREVLRTIPADAVIAEMNYWGDKCWGVCIHTFKGDNNLGKILMDIRDANRHKNAVPPKTRIIRFFNSKNELVYQKIFTPGRSLKSSDLTEAFCNLVGDVRHKYRDMTPEELIKMFDLHQINVK